MYAIIRRYTFKGGTVDRKTMDDLKRRTEAEFAPQLQDIPGFHGYHLVNVNDSELVTLGLFEDRAGLGESTRRAAEFVKKLPISDRIGTPEVMEGEVLVSREAPVGAR
jgi:hypothetical protein